MNLDEIRKRIDEIDSGILDLVAQRMQLAKPIAEYKNKGGMQLEDKTREREIIKKRIEKYVQEGLGGENFIEDLFELLFKESKRLQKKRVEELKKEYGQENEKDDNVGFKVNRKCEFCRKENKTMKSEFCDWNCYQKWRYNNLPSVKKKQIENQKVYYKKRYLEDAEFRRKQKEYSRNWQKKNPERVREIARKSAKKRYYEKNEDS